MSFMVSSLPLDSDLVIRLVLVGMLSFSYAFMRQVSHVELIIRIITYKGVMLLKIILFHFLWN